MNKHRKRESPLEHPLFTIEERNEILMVEFVGSIQEILGMKLDGYDQLRGLVARQKKNPSKAVVFTAKPGILSPENVDRILVNHGLSPSGQFRETREGEKQSDLSDFMREMNTAKILIQELRTLDAFVIAALGGDMPLALFGTALACDYRIATDDFTLVNRIPQTGFAPLAGLPWFLAQMIGQVKARALLMNGKTLSACEALQLGLVNRTVGEDQLKQEAFATAEHVAALPWGARVGLKRAFARADEPLGDYLESEAAIFKRSLDMMVAATNATSLENVT